MKPILMIKMTLNTLMTLILASLFFLKSTGVAYHEIAGIALAVIVVIHLILNRKWIKSITQKLPQGTVKPKTLGMYILNALTFLSMASVIITGICISRVVFPNGMKSEFLWTAHTVTAYASLALCALHILVHGKYIIAFFRKFVALKLPKRVWGTASSMAAVAVIAGILYHQFFAGLQGAAAVTGILPSTSVIESSSQNSSNIEASNDVSFQTGEQSEDTSNTTLESSASSEPAVTLTSFLGNLHCTACHKHCSLISPQCGKGENQAETATVEYNETYDIDATSI